MSLQRRSQWSRSPASVSPQQPSPPSRRREEAGALACLTSAETKPHVTQTEKHRTHTNQAHCSYSPIVCLTFRTYSHTHICWPVSVLAGIIGALVPCCLDLSLAHQYGECLCMPLLPGSTFAIRVGIRERYKIRVSVSARMQEAGGLIWLPLLSAFLYKIRL